MSKNSEHHDTYIIPPNFIEGSTLFGGMFKIRNVIEAGVLAAAVGVPVFYLDLSLTVRVIILCLTALCADGRCRRAAFFIYHCLFQVAQEPPCGRQDRAEGGTEEAETKKRKATCVGKRVDAIGDRRCYPQAVGKEKAYRRTPGGKDTKTGKAAPQEQSGLTLSQSRSGVSAD